MKFAFNKVKAAMPTNNQKGERGAVAVEFALVFPLFLLVLFATYELGIYIHNKQVITQAAREGARFGVIMRTNRPTESQIRDRVKERSQILINTELEDADITVNGATGGSGTTLSVTVNASFPFPVLSNFSAFPAEFDLVAQSNMLKE